MTKSFALLALLVSAPAFAQAQQAQQPQPVAKTEFLARIDAGFNEVDANKDGFSDRAEILASETKVLNMRKAAALKQSEEVFKQLDANKDGRLTVQEFTSKLAATPIQADAAPALNQLDKNKDGKVSKEENRAPAVATFDRVDTNKDGTLSVAEQQAAVQAQRPQGR